MFLKLFARMLAPLLLSIFLPLSGAHATTMNILYSFCSVPTYCQDGYGPSGSLLPDGSGGFYGTAASSGPNGGGVVFHLTAAGGTWSSEVVYSFCAQPDCSDGSVPMSGVIADEAGNLYGVTTYKGNSNNGGTIYKLIPYAGHTKWKIKVLHRFCALANCADGKFSNGLAYVGQAAGVPYDGTSPLYGTTSSSGANSGGVAYSLTPDGSKWRFKVLHTFGDPNSAGDGASPSRLVIDSVGDMFVPTNEGGAHRSGAVVKFTPKRAGEFKESIVYSFCSQAGCADGSGPGAPLILDAAGNLFGTTSGGGGGHSDGSVLKLAPNGNHYDLTTLYSFCSQSDCPDGMGPGQLTLDSQGHIYGTTVYGGDPNMSGGVVFTLNPTFHLLYVFCSQSPTCKDGQYPGGALIVDGQNKVFGLTYNGGAHNSGEFFEISP